MLSLGKDILESCIVVPIELGSVERSSWVLHGTQICKAESNQLSSQMVSNLAERP